MSTSNRADHPHVIALPPLIFLGCVAAGGLLHLVLPLRVLTHYGLSLALGVVLAVVSLALGYWAARVMAGAGTNVRPDRPTLVIVSSGPYRFTRNPMYLSLCLLQFGVAFMLDGVLPLLATVLLALILHYGVILPEERYLAAKFGEPYLAFKRRVRRWL